MAYNETFIRHLNRDSVFYCSLLKRLVSRASKLFVHSHDLHFSVVGHKVVAYHRYFLVFIFQNTSALGVWVFSGHCECFLWQPTQL